MDNVFRNELYNYNKRLKDLQYKHNTLKYNLHIVETIKNIKIDKSVQRLLDSTDIPHIFKAIVKDNTSLEFTGSISDLQLLKSTMTVALEGVGKSIKDTIVKWWNKFKDMVIAFVKGVRKFFSDSYKKIRNSLENVKKYKGADPASESKRKIHDKVIPMSKLSDIGSAVTKFAVRVGTAVEFFSHSSDKINIDPNTSELKKQINEVSTEHTNTTKAISESYAGELFGAFEIDTDVDAIKYCDTSANIAGRIAKLYDRNLDIWERAVEKINKLAMAGADDNTMDTYKEYQAAGGELHRMFISVENFMKVMVTNVQFIEHIMRQAQAEG